MGRGGARTVWEHRAKRRFGFGVGLAWLFVLGGDEVGRKDDCC
jgi:hypothetical protein